MRLLPLHVQSYLMVAFPLWVLYEWGLPWLYTQAEVDHALPPLMVASTAILATVSYFVCIYLICRATDEEFEFFSS